MKLKYHFYAYIKQIILIIAAYRYRVQVVTV